MTCNIRAWLNDCLLYPFVLTFAISAVIFGVVVWTIWTHDLHYNVYSDGVVWYREYFPTYFNLTFTTVLSVAFGLSVTVIICITRYRKNDSGLPNALTEVISPRSK